MAIQYYMRGWNGSAYVDWVVNDQPDSTGAFAPSGGLTNIVVNRIVQSKVDNFIKPNEGLNSPSDGSDGYWIHVNSIDWLHAGSNVPLPPQISGLAVVRGSTGITPNDYSTLFWDETNQTWKFAFNTGGDGTTVGALQNVALGAMSMNGPLTIGTPAAQTGLIRIPSNQLDTNGNTGAIKSRNTSDSGDVWLISSDNADRVQIGSSTDSVYVPANLRVDSAITHSYDNGDTRVAQSGFIRTGANEIQVAARDIGNGNDIVLLETDLSDRIIIGGFVPANNDILYNTRVSNDHIFATNSSAQVRISQARIRFDGAVPNPRITQDPTSVGNGQPLLIEAQQTTDVTGTGGNAVLQGGLGPVANGSVVLTTGTTINPEILISPTSITVNQANVNFGTQIVTPKISQNAAASSGTQTTPLSVVAQSNTGSGAGTQGSNLILSSGTAPSIGATGAGHVLIQTGGTTWIDVNPSTSPFATITINGNLTVLGTTTTVDSTTVDIVGRVIHGNYSTGIVGAPAAPNLANSMTGFAIHRGSATGISGQDRDSAALIYNETTNIYNDGYWKLAVVKNDVDTASSTTGLVGTLPLLTSGVVVSPNAVQEFSAPTAIPTVGGLRTLNNTVAVSSRNAASSADLLLLGTDASNHIVHGAISSPQNAGHIFNTSTGSLYDFWVNSSSIFQMGTDGFGSFIRQTTNPSSIGAIRLSTGNGVYGKNAANTSNMILVSSTGFAGYTNAAGVVSDAVLVSGQGFPVILGDNVIMDGYTASFIGAHSGTNDGYAYLLVGSAVASGATCALEIAPQSSTFAGSTGGNLDLRSGTGVSANGVISFYSGANVSTPATAQISGSKFVFSQGRRRHVTSITGTYAVSTSDDLIAITTLSTAFTITLPSSPVTGDSYEVKDTVGNAGTNNVTISGNGHNIDGASTFVLSQPYAAVTVTYTGTQWSVT